MATIIISLIYGAIIGEIAKNLWCGDRRLFAVWFSAVALLAPTILVMGA